MTRFSKPIRRSLPALLLLAGVAMTQPAAAQFTCDLNGTDGGPNAANADRDATATGNGSLACGLDALAAADYANAIGVGSYAAEVSALAIGNTAWATGERAIALGRRDNLTVRQLAQRLGGFGGLAMVGTPRMVADEMEEWLKTEASDGFTIQFPYLPGSLDEFCDLLIPELQRRGLFRREYEGATLRENLGLPRPENRFFTAKAGPQAAE